MILGILLLLTGLTISAVAIYYSVLGLAAIFAAATVPIYVMGGTLEVAKLVAASWLKANWHRVSGIIKWYMSAAVLILMMITSMGIFGFLSKAHLDQSVPTGDVAAQVALIDEKIKTQRDNIEAARAALSQMDAQVNQRLSGSNVDQSAERSVQIRRQQAGERARLQKEIGDAQREIAKLNEQRAPVASQLRKVEAEVGPIKYIAQFIYGQEADQNLLEKAVTWVIILIVIVFDPLALAMLLAAQMTFGWLREPKKLEELVVAPGPVSVAEPIKEEENKSTEGNSPEKESDIVSTATVTEPAPHHPDTHPYLTRGFVYPEGYERVKPLVAHPLVEEQVEKPVDFEDSTFPPIEITVDNTEVKINEDSVDEESSKKKIHDQTEWKTVSDDQEIMYVQNSEQNETSLWNRVRKKISDEFKPKDYLNIVYSRSKFEDIQYDPEQDPDLDKFIKDIQNGTHSFGDYPQEELKKYASRIYELRKD